MSFDYRKLKGKIIERYGSQQRFAQEFGCSNRTMTLKMTGKRSWKQEEILRATKLLGLSEKDIQEYFFNVKVQNFEQKKE